MLFVLLILFFHVDAQKVPSRVILPPELPHYIFFQPMVPFYPASNLSLPPHACLDKGTLCGFDSLSYPHVDVKEAFEAYNEEFERLIKMVRPQDIEVIAKILWCVVHFKSFGSS